MDKILKNNIKYISVIFISLILFNICNVVSPYILKVIIDTFFVKSNEIDLKLSLIGMVGIYVFLRIMMVVFEQIKNCISNKTSNKILNELRSNIFDKVLNMKMNTFTKFKSSDIYTRLTIDAENVKSLLSDKIPKISNNLIYIITMMVVMISINFKLSMIGYAIIFIMTIGSYIMVKKLRGYSKNVFKYRDLENKEYSEDYDKSKMTKMFSLEKRNITKMTELFQRELKARKKYINFHTIMFPFHRFMEAIAVYVIIYYVLNIETSISLGTVYMFLSYITQCFTPIRDTFDQLEDIQTAHISLDKINSILKVKEKPENINKGLHIEKLNGNIEFQNVEFKYKRKTILKDVTFEIKQGEKVAIIGKTGSGKTTITNILMRMYDIQSGKILIDGHDLYDISIRSIRNNVSYISQNSYMMKDTVRNNIILDSTDITDKQIIEVAERIGALPLIQRLEHGLDEVVSTDRLSKGEMQILAFIRAIVHKANIYIFDEPTSNIDLRTEKMIQLVIDRISKESTVIIIAHRLATIQNVDKVIQIGDGCVLQSISYKE